MYTHVIEPVIKALQETLRLAVKFERTQKQRSELRAVIRKLMVIRELHTNYFVSVMGTQGAGKTRLVREMYGLDDWLEDNAGRGERRPLFIIESDCEKAYACGVSMDGVEVAIDRKKLKQELRSFSETDDFLLLRLYVPKRFAGNGFGFLLLPGYERLNPENQQWQMEMRDTLKHSIGSILVTDQTRMARQENQRILDDLMDTCMENRSPIVVVARTERMEESIKEELRGTAAEKCRVKAEDMGRVICTGVGEEYRKIWLPQLEDSLKNYTKASHEVNRERLDDLMKVVDVELEAAVNLLEDLVGDASNKAKGQDLLLESILKKFRESADKYRSKFERKLHERSGPYVSTAIQSAKKDYMAQEEGVPNKFRNLIDRIRLNNSVIEERFQDRIISNWKQAHENRTPLEITYLALSDMANQNLQLAYNRNDLDKEVPKLPSQFGKHDVTVLLGYQGDEKPIKFLGKDYDADRLKNSLRLLLQRPENPQQGDILQLEKHQAQSREISTAVELLPTLGMEFMRLTQAAVLAVEAAEIPDIQLRALEPEELMKQIAKGLPDMVQNTKEVISTVLAISAVDLGLDGSLDVATILTGGHVAGLGATLSVAAAGLISLGYVGVKISDAIHQYDIERKGVIALSMNQLSNVQIEKTLQIFDDVMEQLEERLTHNLSLAYGIDRDHFSERDAMARALYSLKRAQHDLTEEINFAQSRFLV